MIDSAQLKKFFLKRIVLQTLSDFTLAAAANSYGSVALSINANISYFRPPKGKILTAEAQEVS